MPGLLREIANKKTGGREIGPPVFYANLNYEFNLLEKSIRVKVFFVVPGLEFAESLDADNTAPEIPSLQVQQRRRIGQVAFPPTEPFFFRDFSLADALTVA